jgi:protein-disulfide isomerase
MAQTRKQASRSRTAEQERLRQEKLKRDRRIRFAVFGGGLVVVIAIIVVAVWGINKAQAGGDTAPLHAEVSASGEYTGITLASDNLAAGAPTLDIYTDFQCPSCATYESALGDTIADLIDQGLVKVTFHTMTFLDAANGATNSRSSTRAAVAAACADTLAGDYYLPMFQTIYANQPETEGDGFTETQLRSTFPATAGISGDDLTAYLACYDERETGQFVADVDDWSTATAGASTPQFKLNGIAITSDVSPYGDDPSGALIQLVADATTD